MYEVSDEKSMSAMRVIRGLVRVPSLVMRALIRLYQLTLSKALGPRCKYYPSCSHYAQLCFEVHGFWKGTVLTLWRLLRCNPLSDGGVDYPPLRGEWKNPWTSPGSITRETYTKETLTCKDTAEDVEKVTTCC